MTTRALKDSELVDYSDTHSATMGTQPGRINPYKLGVELFRHIDECDLFLLFWSTAAKQSRWVLKEVE